MLEVDERRHRVRRARDKTESRGPAGEALGSVRVDEGQTDAEEGGHDDDQDGGEAQLVDQSEDMQWICYTLNWLGIY